MTGLYVPLDVNYFEDDKILAVPPTAELLYVRSLAVAKRTRMNGLLANRGLSTIALRIDNRQRYVRALVDAGLWTENSEGWYITGWLNHNRPVEELSETRADAGAMGAHIRWHVKPGKPNEACQFCRDPFGDG